MKPVIIGQAPARGNDNKPPFSGQSGRRLAQLIGVGAIGDVLSEYFELHNLIPHYPGKNGKGDSFDMKVARQNAQILIHDLNQGPSRNLILMGRKVRKAMGLNGDWQYLTWVKFGKHWAAVFPHPSGVNRWWNDPNQHDRAAEWLRWVVMDARHG